MNSRDRKLRDELPVNLVQFLQDCEDGHKAQLVNQMIFTLICILGISLVVYLLKESCKKVIKIQSKDPEIKEDCYDTYCVISLCLLACSQLALVLCLLQFLLTIFMAWFNFDNHPDYDILFLGFYKLVYSISEYFLVIIFFGQLIEQWVIHFLIQFEHQYTLEEIVYLHDNTGIFFEKEKKVKRRISITFHTFNILVICAYIDMWFGDLPGFNIIDDLKF